MSAQRGEAASPTLGSGSQALKQGLHLLLPASSNFGPGAEETPGCPPCVTLGRPLLLRSSSPCWLCLAGSGLRKEPGPLPWNWLGGL